MLKFGLVGCGVIHGTHADALKKIDGVKLMAVYDIDPVKAKAASDKYGVKSTKTLKGLFDEVDVVNVLVPSGLHGQIGIKAARAGKHVIVEKPIEVKLSTAEKLVKTARESGVKLTTISQHRFAQDIRTLHAAAQSGDLGPLLEGDAYNKWYRSQAYYASAGWRGTWALDGGGCLMNQGVHYVDMIQWVMGGVKAVQAQIRTAARSIEVEDVANALIEYKNGATGVIQASTAYFPGLAERMEVHGKYASVIIEGDKTKVWETNEDKDGDRSLYGRGVQSQPTPNVHSHGTDPKAGVAADPKAIWIDLHRAQLEDFTKAVIDNREPFITGEMALEPLKIILGIYRSGKRNGARVEIE